MLLTQPVILFCQVLPNSRRNREEEQAENPTAMQRG